MLQCSTSGAQEERKDTTIFYSSSEVCRFSVKKDKMTEMTWPWLTHHILSSSNKIENDKKNCSLIYFYSGTLNQACLYANI